jgi:hypothetical protein
VVSSGESSPADLGSSNRASLSGRAEGHFLAQPGTARYARPGYQTTKFVKISVEMGIAELNRATKHALKLKTQPSLLYPPIKDDIFGPWHPLMNIFSLINILLEQ